MASGRSTSSSPRTAPKPRCWWSSRPAPNFRSQPSSAATTSWRCSANGTTSNRATRSGSSQIQDWRICSTSQAGDVSTHDNEGNRAMTIFTRRTLVQGATSLAATGALAGPALLEWSKAWAQAAPGKPEKGGQLGSLRWKYFVQSEDDAVVALNDAFPTGTGV